MLDLVDTVTKSGSLTYQVVRAVERKYLVQKKENNHGRTVYVGWKLREHNDSSDTHLWPWVESIQSHCSLCFSIFNVMQVRKSVLLFLLLLWIKQQLSIVITNVNSKRCGCVLNAMSPLVYPMDWWHVRPVLATRVIPVKKHDVPMSTFHWEAEISRKTFSPVISCFLRWCQISLSLFFYS